jgi:hypothetical protein
MTPSLRELQQAFATSIFEGIPPSPSLPLPQGGEGGEPSALRATSIDRHVRDGAFPAARHVQVYRHNTYANLTEALGAVYPVIQQLVGVDFFEHTAAHFIRQSPPRAANLHDFGGDFADFLAGFAPAQSLVYLPDVARLEWAWHEAFHAADAAPLALETLASVDPADHAALVFCLHPSTRLLASGYPVDRIWQVNQPGFDGDASVNLDDGGARLLVRRRGLSVEVVVLGPGEYALLRAFADGRPLGAATDAATAAEAEFDLMQTLLRHIQTTTLVGFSC